MAYFISGHFNFSLKYLYFNLKHYFFNSWEKTHFIHMNESYFEKLVRNLFYQYISILLHCFYLHFKQGFILFQMFFEFKLNSNTIRHYVYDFMKNLFIAYDLNVISLNLTSEFRFFYYFRMVYAKIYQFCFHLHFEQVRVDFIVSIN